MKDEMKVRIALLDEMEGQILAYQAASSPSRRRAIRQRTRLRKIERNFTRLAADELGYSSAIITWVVWFLLSKAVQAIIVEMAKQLYEHLRNESMT